MPHVRLSSSAPVRRPSSSRLALLAALVVSALALGSCSTLGDMFGAANDAEKSVKNEAAGALGGSGTCCVNQQFFECPSSGAALQCLGEPMELSSCMNACPVSDNDCSLRCLGEHGPDTSGCTRAPTRDGECPAK